MNRGKEEFASLYQPAETPGAAVERLMAIIHLLRGRDGCPWDRAQTHESLRQCLIEEAYEACDAIDRKDMDNLEEELGDVLLQIVFHGDLGAAEDKFDLKTISNRVSDKMIRRHPHIFSKDDAKTIDKVLEKWENVKRQEGGTLTHTERLESVPKALPALTRSYKIQAKAAEIGFDRDCVEKAFSQIREETDELLEAWQDGKENGVAEELGDLLFSVVNAARFLNINPEDALNHTSQKFIHRFQFIEQTAGQNGKRPEDMSLAEKDALREAARQHGNYDR